MGLPEYDSETGGVKGPYVDDTGAVASDSFGVGDTVYARLQRTEGRFNIEQRGIERVPDDERSDKSLVKVGTLWLSANMVGSSFAIGALGNPIFCLGFIDSILAVTFFNLLGALPVSFFSTFGPRFGLRQMVLSRFFFGYYGVKLSESPPSVASALTLNVAVAFFNILACVGWSAVNVIVGAQLLNAVNANVPGYAGIIIIAAATFLVTLFGYKVVHGYEAWSWIPAFVVWLIVLGEFVHSGVSSFLRSERLRCRGLSNSPICLWASALPRLAPSSPLAPRSLASRRVGRAMRPTTPSTNQLMSVARAASCGPWLA